MRHNFFYHLHPPTIPKKQARFRYTLGAGGLAVFLSLILLVTGILEMFFYVPAVEQAAESVQTIAYLVPYGDLIRNLHFWAAQFLLVVSGVHLLRVIFTGAYTPPRHLNTLIGLGLGITVVLMDFTGYILRWDEGIFWALVTGTNLVKTIPLIGNTIYRILVGGVQPGSATLIRFYAWHIFGLTLVSVVLGVWHIFRVRRDGGIAAPPTSQRESRKRIPRHTLIQREVLAMLLAGSALLILSIFSPAPIAAPIITGTSNQGETLAPWFFLWIQQLLKFGDPFLWGVLVPSVILIIFGLTPYIFPSVDDSELGRWFPAGNRVAQVSTGLIVVFMIVLTLLALLSPET
ncbi:MAG TPA: cytochrome bc complex cytochrome b subunit [Anaerolineae bacterium]|nr:cytochrome bc complex cytochrome b subunit [Anaerolineae bacterium]